MDWFGVRAVMIFKRVGSGIGVYDAVDNFYGVIMQKPDGRYWWNQNCHAINIYAIDLIEIASVMDELDGKYKTYP